jgi:TonB family protein
VEPQGSCGLLLRRLPQYHEFWDQEMKLAALILIAAVGSLPAQEISHHRPPKIIHKVEPEYTEEARKANLQGTVVLTTFISTDGVPEGIKVVRQVGGGLDERAIECLRQWRFRPALDHDEPVVATITIEFDFRLPGRNSK